MVDVPPLGWYTSGNDNAFDFPVHELLLFVTDAGQPSFCYHYEYATNHGYDEAWHTGTYQWVEPHTLIFTVHQRALWGWEDYFKKYYLIHKAHPLLLQTTYQQEEQGRGSLIYAGEDLMYTDKPLAIALKHFRDIQVRLDHLQQRQHETPEAFDEGYGV